MMSPTQGVAYSEELRLGIEPRFRRYEGRVLAIDTNEAGTH
jgi:hypothetical protein